MINDLTIPPEAEPILIQFAEYLAASDELQNEIDTSVDIEVAISDGSSVTRSEGDQYVRVVEHGNDGYELVQQTDDEGNITGYDPEGTSKVGKYVQDMADEFFGGHNYSCGFYEDENRSRTSITP